MSHKNGALTFDEAEAVMAVLIDECGAKRDDGFTYHQTGKHVAEWRFCGSLGFGGKFWRTTGRRADDSWGEMWRVDCYREDETPERLESIARANARLWELQQEVEGAVR